MTIIDIRFIGSGQVGKWMAGHLAGQHFNLLANDRNPSAVHLLAEKGPGPDEAREILSLDPFPKHLLS